MAALREGTWLGQKAVLVQRKDAPSYEHCRLGQWNVARFPPHRALCVVPQPAQQYMVLCVECHCI